MFVDRADTLGDVDRQRMPAALAGVVGIEVVLAVLAGTAAVFDDVLVVVADDDGEVTVLFDSPLRDGLDGALAAVAVQREDRVDDRWL